MAGFRLSEYVRRPMEEVFEFLVDPGNTSLVAHEVRRVEPAGSDEKQAGARYIETRQVAGKEVHSEVEVVEFQRPYRYVVAQEREGLRAVYAYSLSPVDRGTRLELEAEINAEGPRAALAWLAAEVMRRRDADLLERVRQGMKRAEEEKDGD